MALRLNFLPFAVTEANSEKNYSVVVHSAKITRYSSLQWRDEESRLRQTANGKRELVTPDHVFVFYTSWQPARKC